MTTLAGQLLQQFSLIQYVEFFARLLTACICGACIGFERTKRLKEAGVSTHIIVCCAAALTMIVSKYGFVDLASESGALFGTRGADPARIAAQIVSGISFLGAGIIFRNGSNVRGLTTAAGIWATAGIGLAIGSGMYIIGLEGTIIVALIQILMHRFTVGVDSMVIGKISCTVTDARTFKKALAEYLEENKMHIISNKVSFQDDGTATLEYTLRMNASMTLTELTSFMESIEGVRSLSCEIGR